MNIDLIRIHKTLLQKAYFPKLFWIVLGIKILASTLFASHFVTKGFLPFVTYFVTTGANPYDYFYQQGIVVFPYPAAMLFIISSFWSIGYLILGTIITNIHISLLLFRIPILVADICIYVILCFLLPGKHQKVFWWYFASPILFYINYYHGQLDVIPTAFLFLSLYGLWGKKYVVSYILLGIGIATKTHLLIVLPFYAIYVLRQKSSFLFVSMLSLGCVLLFIVGNLPLVSKYYLLTVFNNVEQQRLFLTTLSYHYKDLVIYVAPAALLSCLYIFASSNKRVNFDSLLLILALVYTILIALVPPMQGWFYWSIPLFIFFLVKYKESHLLSFLLTNVFFLLFYLCSKDSDIIESALVSFPFLLQTPTPYALLTNYGLNALQFQNILFTCLQVSVGLNAFWCYKMGIYYNNLYIEKQKAFIIGIGGDSGVGKSTLSEGIADIVGKQQLVVLNGDDSHRWERHDKHWEYFTHLNPKSNTLHNDVEQMYALIDGKTIQRTYYDHKTGTFTKTEHIEKNKFVIFQGLHPFYLEKMRDIYDIKIFVEAQESLRKKWKLQRDGKQRGYTQAKITQTMKKREKDAVKYIKPQKNLSDWIITYYNVKNMLCVKYIFSNSIPLEKIVAELTEHSHLKIHHEYINTKLQSISLEGKISKQAISKVVYKLYPNVYELIHHEVRFRDHIEGLNQLFFINYLNYFFVNRQSKVVG